MILAIQLIVIVILLHIAAHGKASMDTIRFHYSGSYFETLPNQKFWNPFFSDSNKYKNGNKSEGPAGIGSTTFMVWKYSGWHRMQMIFLNSMFAVVGVASTMQIGWWSILLAIVAAIGFKVDFELKYRKLSNRV